MTIRSHLKAVSISFLFLVLRCCFGLEKCNLLRGRMVKRHGRPQKKPKGVEIFLEVNWQSLQAAVRGLEAKSPAAGSNGPRTSALGNFTIFIKITPF